MSGPDFTIVAVAITLASCLQASIGFGIGMLAAPVVALIDPTLVPGTIIMLASVVTLLITIVERTHLDLGGTGWALLGRVPGSVVGAVLVAWMPARLLALLIAAVVIGGIVVTVAGWAPRPRPLTLVSAGAASGIMGTATSIGGAPMALVWQRSPGPQLRSTMSAFFLVGSAFSVAALTVTGGIDGSTLGTFAALAPAALVGCVLSRFVNRWLSRERLRWTAITVSAVGALVLVGQQLL